MLDFISRSGSSREPVMPSDGEHKSYSDGLSGRYKETTSPFYQQGRLARDQLLGTNDTGLNPPQQLSGGSGPTRNGCAIILGIVILILAVVTIIAYAIAFSAPTPPRDVPYGGTVFFFLFLGAIDLWLFWPSLKSSKGDHNPSPQPQTPELVDQKAKAFAPLPPPASADQKVKASTQPPHSPALEDIGRRILLSNDGLADDVLVIVKMVSQARAKGWTSIHFTGGNDSFKANIWLEAERQGMTVNGFTPSAELRARCDEWNKKVQAAQSKPPN